MSERHYLLEKDIMRDPPLSDKLLTDNVRGRIAEVMAITRAFDDL